MNEALREDVFNALSDFKSILDDPMRETETETDENVTTFNQILDQIISHTASAKRETEHSLSYIRLLKELRTLATVYKNSGETGRNAVENVRANLYERALSAYNRTSK